MQPKNIKRLLRALSRQGLDVTYYQHTYSVRLANSPDAPVAEVLLPEGFPIEAKALKQLANLANVRHPAGGCVCRACATPDFHPGDAGVAIGSVVETEGQVIPSALGSDINCGMRLHVADLTIDEFLAKRHQFVELMKGDYFFGTRDVTMTAGAMRALFEDGVPGWLDAMLDHPTGSVVKSDLHQLTQESDGFANAFGQRIFLGGSMDGSWKLAPPELVPDDGLVRDGGLATIGSGNHFVEVQRVDRVENRALAHIWGVREGQITFMIHSGSRNVGKYIGGMWRDRAKATWPKGLKYPDAQIFPLSTHSHPELVTSYLQAEATAANYGFVNRLLLAELLRLRLREVYGDVAAPLVYDLPHNITLPQVEDMEMLYATSAQSQINKWVTRKGACPAYAGQPVIIPGSMGAYSYLMVGRGNPAFCYSASHGAGRARSRFELNRRGALQTEAELGLTGVDCITLRKERRIEEAPAAYKPIESVIDVQVNAEIIDVVARLSPVLTFKA
ncbi:MAG: RtcB family protein [Desmonostoc vinosum HA7617-LM4]|jgi:tRNA-splicing ligase RtcB|nr:RtcB family protein [Desmonostoc vinosum HA7617-LM4]